MYSISVLYYGLRKGNIDDIVKLVIIYESKEFIEPGEEVLSFLVAQGAPERLANFRPYISGI
jgi:hypothetical protein